MTQFNQVIVQWISKNLAQHNLGDDSWVPYIGSKKTQAFLNSTVLFNAVKAEYDIINNKKLPEKIAFMWFESKFVLQYEKNNRRKMKLDFIHYLDYDGNHQLAGCFINEKSNPKLLNKIYHILNHRGTKIIDLLLLPDWMNQNTSARSMHVGLIMIQKDQSFKTIYKNFHAANPDWEPIKNNQSFHLANRYHMTPLCNEESKTILEIHGCDWFLLSEKLFQFIDNINKERNLITPLLPLPFGNYPKKWLTIYAQYLLNQSSFRFTHKFHRFKEFHTLLKSFISTKNKSK